MQTRPATTHNDAVELQLDRVNNRSVAGPDADTALTKIFKSGGYIMDRNITDMIYAQTVTGKSAELELKEQQLYKRLSALIPDKEYLKIEEELNRHYEELCKELFCKGFTEGIRFLLKCL